MNKAAQETKAARPQGVSRRGFLLKTPVVAGMGAMACAGAGGASTAATGQPSAEGESYSAAGVPRLVLEDNAAVVETAYGRGRGFIRNGIRTFRGIPYAGDPSGANRFMPPTKPTPWTGVRSSLYWGPCCPQVVPRRDNDEIVFFGNPPAAEYREDCQRLNVWTPGLDHAKRPVMVWMHGGGFTHGCAQLCFYDGENLAHRGNVVVVSLTHHLNALGSLNLASFSSKYADSANVGVMDLVAALEWVRENIAGFGGNPDNVMIFGESGGGSKVLTILNGRPRAFHMAEISFVFYTTDLSEVRTGATDEARALAAKMCDCWVAFARSGDPNHPGVPHWPVYDPQTVPTMIFETSVPWRTTQSARRAG